MNVEGIPLPETTDWLYYALHGGGALLLALVAAWIVDFVRRPQKLPDKPALPKRSKIIGTGESGPSEARSPVGKPESLIPAYVAPEATETPAIAYPYPVGRPPSRWGPGAIIPEHRPGEFNYVQKFRTAQNYDQYAMMAAGPLFMTTAYCPDPMTMAYCPDPYQAANVDREAYLKLLANQQNGAQKNMTWNLRNSQRA